ncbi:MAG: B12-binding domain-containing radical SAM protein [Nitrospinaceae bacterium]|nr:MAG: B12-binding domain-containing radical SAM protein [Nitrospinaceae bacterium]
MKRSIGLITLNAKFIQTALSLRYLRNAARTAGFQNVWIEEFVINQPVWKIAAEIQKRRTEILGVSIYIWNRHQSFELIERLKKQNPELKIVIGGPEVSFEKELSDQYTTISGEGESKWVEFLKYQERNENPTQEVLDRWNTYGVDLPDLAPPYLEEDLPNLKNRIAYLETSRGCPYLCSFCLSALDKKVRYFEQDATKKQIEKLVTAGARRIKFVDRTFNLKPKQMQELMQWLTRFRGASFHFEVVADILTPDILDFLATVPEGMFQFEIGVQTTDDSTQDSIQRKQNNQKLFDAIAALSRQNKIHCHCDLIFGLPGETLEQMLNSFEEVLSLKPHELQLGFLKFLPGAPINSVIESCGYQFQSTPPYELISSNDLSADGVIYLKKFTEVFELFYNSKRFRFTIENLLKTWTPVKLFDHILQYMDEKNLLFRSHSLDSQYKILHDAFLLGGNDLEFDLLKLDYLYSQRIFHLPRFLKNRLGESGELKQKTWQGDRKSPMIPFHHEIQKTGSGVKMVPSPAPRHYVIAHPNGDSGYIQQPAIILVND